MNHASSELLGPAGLARLHFFDESPLFFFIFISVFADHPLPPEGALSLSVFSFILYVRVCASVKRWRINPVDGIIGRKHKNGKTSG